MPGRTTCGGNHRGGHDRLRAQLLFRKEQDGDHGQGRGDQEDRDPSHGAERLPDGRADGDAAPDAGREDAERLRAPGRWSDVDHPSDRAGNEEALAESVQDAGRRHPPQSKNR